MVHGTNLVLLGAEKGQKELEQIKIPDNEVGGWRVEEEFINAIRREELITHTSFTDGVKYMKFTDAIYDSFSTGQKIII